MINKGVGKITYVASDHGDRGCLLFNFAVFFISMYFRFRQVNQN
jgi:hypothetical protein